MLPPRDAYRPWMVALAIVVGIGTGTAAVVLYQTTFAALVGVGACVLSLLALAERGGEA